MSELIILFNDAASTAVDLNFKCEYCETELSESFSLAPAKHWSGLPKPVRTRIEIIRPPERK